MRWKYLLVLTLGVGCDGAFGSKKAEWESNLAVKPIGAQASHVSIHRLTNDEYTNSVQDLLFTTSRPGDDFPLSSLGESGYKNDSVALATTDEWVARAYEAADKMANELIGSKGNPSGAYARVISTCSNSACATDVLTALATRAYRRPAASDEVAQLVAAFSGGTTFDDGIHDAVVALLLSPKFLFLANEPTGSDTTFTLDDYALASRLSYFLWQTMPDDALFTAAGNGELSTDAGLDTQIQRMLADPRASRLAKTLVREWAGVAPLESSSITGLDESLRAAMVKETDMFMADILAGDRSFLNVVNGDYTFANQALATLYGIDFPAQDPNTFVQVDLPLSKMRSGIVTHASVLTVTAGSPQVTHPVRRGLWVTKRVMCAAPPPPPMNVPPLASDASNSLTIRERLDAHVAAPACSGCHVVMDAVGLGLENYDPFGRWRDTYASNGASIDATGTLPDGYDFTDPMDMYGELASDITVRTCLAKQVMSLALTRVLSGPADLALAREIGKTHITKAGSFSGMISAIVRSPQFRQQVTEAR